jgi:hypothetical protein
MATVMYAKMLKEVQYVTLSYVSNTGCKMFNQGLPLILIINRDCFPIHQLDLSL